MFPTELKIKIKILLKYYNKNIKKSKPPMAEKVAFERVILLIRIMENVSFELFH